MIALKPRLSVRWCAAVAAFLLATSPYILSLSAAALAPPGGPIDVGGPNFGIAGTPFVWDPAAMPIQYRVDPGPMSINPSGAVVVDNPTGLSRLVSMLSVWSSVPTASVSFNNAGTLLPTGAYTGGPVVNGSASLANFNALKQSCDSGQQSPVIFDPNGSLLSQLGVTADLIGLTFSCDLDPSTQHIKAAGILLNGVFQDGVNAGNNFELTADEFNQAITHEIGHFIGLDHSQINVEVLTQQPGSCNLSDLAGLPLMFPFLVCQARIPSGFPALAPDDTAWVSRLYPVTTSTAGKVVTSTAYGTISGTVYFTDGVTQVQGVNVIAQQVGNPLAVAFSVISGYQFTGNPGQSVTGNNAGGSQMGSRDTRLIGTFDIPAAPGTYNLHLESINSNFSGTESVGPLPVVIPIPGTPPSSGLQVSVVAGGTVTLNIVLTGTAPRFDSFESSELIVRDPLSLWKHPSEFAGSWAR